MRSAPVNDLRPVRCASRDERVVLLLNSARSTQPSGTARRDRSGRAVVSQLDRQGTTERTASELADAEGSFRAHAGACAGLLTCLLLATGWLQVLVAALLEVLR